MDDRTIISRPGESADALAARLGRLTPGRVVLVIEDGVAASFDLVDLQRLQRQAARNRLELALVTDNPDLVDAARELRLPVFASVEEAHNRPLRFRLPDRSFLFRPPPAAWIDPEDALEVWQRHRRERRRPAAWLWALSALAFVLALAVVVLGTLVVWPSAHIRLVPISRPVGAVVTLVADPGAQEVDEAAGVVPARYLPVEVEGEAHITTTGVKDIPDAPARGRVVFTNLMPQPLTIPKGTIVRTNAGVPVRFATLTDADVPANGQTMVEVEALDKGPAGNVAAGVISRIEGALAFQLRVTNPEPTQGGAARQVRAVTQADQDRLQAALLEQLQTQALEQMRAELRPTEFVVTPSLQLVDVLDVTTDRYVGEQADVLGMQMRVRMQAIAVDEAPAHQLALAALRRQVIPGYTLIASSVTLPRRNDTVSIDEAGRITFRLAVSGAMTARLDLDEAIRAVRGQPLARARTILTEKLPLESPPDIQVSPPWFPYMPFLGVRITVDLATIDGG